jgi:hypothetical protein
MNEVHGNSGAVARLKHGAFHNRVYIQFPGDFRERLQQEIGNASLVSDCSCPRDGCMGSRSADGRLSSTAAARIPVKPGWVFAA